MLPGEFNGRSEPYSPAGENWLLFSNTKVINDGFEIVGPALGVIGGVTLGLAADALATNVITNLLEGR